MQRDRGLSRSRLQTAYERRARRGVEAGIIRVRIEDEKLDGPYLTIDGTRVVGFGICSYLGLGLDERLRRAASTAVERYGVTHSSSTVYTSLPHYSELEAGLGRMLGGHAIVTPTTTLGHLSALPVLVDEGDLVVVDSQAHASLMLSTQVLAANGAEIQVAPHNDLALLERTIADVPQDRTVWYLADGVYSMFGDTAPVEAIADLLGRYPNLWAYLDDAHGFSWEGRHGRGVVLDRMPFHPRLVLAVSLSKSFGGGGGAIAFPRADLAERTRLLGGPLTFGGPLQTAELAAGVEAVAIHLSDEHAAMRRAMHGQIDLVRRTAIELGLPLVDRSETPIWFVRIGSVDDVVEIVKRMIADGYYLNPSSFPAVPIGSAGVRFTHTLLHSDEQIVSMLERLAHHRAEVVGDDLHVVIDLTDRTLAEEAAARSPRRAAHD